MLYLYRLLAGACYVCWLCLLLFMTCWHFEFCNSLIACGHSFCASCIHRHFCGHLAVHGIGVPPRDRAELQAAIQVIKARGEVPREIFVYSCPHCRTKVQEPPITGYQFKAILSDVKELLNENFKSRNMLGAPSAVPSNAFEGLFVKEVLVD